jgi:Ca2+-binding EF-hand superfamily protein
LKVPGFFKPLHLKFDISWFSKIAFHKWVNVCCYSAEMATLDGEVYKSRVLRRAKKGFDEMDEDGSGSIDLREFSRFLGINGRSAWGERLMAVFDTDGNGSVSFREFVVGMGMLGSKQQESDPMSYFCFRLMDADKSGTLSRDELLSIVWQYVKDQEKAANRAEFEHERKVGKKLSEYWQDEEEDKAPRRDYQGASQLASQNVDKLKKQGNALAELLAWADDAKNAKPTKAAERESAAVRRRRDRMQKIRRQMQSAIILLRQEYPPEITPRDFQAVLAKIPDPFAETFPMFNRLKPYMVELALYVILQSKHQLMQPAVHVTNLTTGSDNHTTRRRAPRSWTLCRRCGWTSCARWGCTRWIQFRPIA